MKNKIREICTYHSDEGTSGYLLTEEQFKKLDDLIDQAYEAGLKDNQKQGEAYRKGYEAGKEEALAEVKKQLGDDWYKHLRLR